MKKSILKENFIYYKDVDITDLESLSYDENRYFFDTENGPIFPKEIVDKYNLTEIEYDTLEEFRDVSKEGLLNTIISEKKLTTEVYVWQFGCNTTDKVYWGNTIQEFIDFIQRIDEYKIREGYIIKAYEVYVHNLAWDIEFFKYWFKEKKFRQIVAGHTHNERLKTHKQQNSFDITETDGTVHNARIQLSKKTYDKKDYLTTISFSDSMKITPLSLKSISKELIEVDDIYIKNSDVYKYNLVRDPKGYVPTDIEAWYIYCDIYLLKEWYNQFVIPNYIDQGVKPYTISQIAFDLILKKTYEKDINEGKYNHLANKSGYVNPRKVYEEHFELRFIEANPMFKEYIRYSYKGGHTTASSKYRQIAEKEVVSGVSMDITSSYPHQMTNKPLPYGRPLYFEGKYKDYTDFRGRVHDYHFITIAFDGFTSKNPGNQFGLNVKLRGLSEDAQRELDCTCNESATTNLTSKGFVGYNRIVSENSIRKKLLQKYEHRSFIVTVSSTEFEEWQKNFHFFCIDKHVPKERVDFIDYISFQSEIGHFADGLDYFFKQKEEGDMEGNKAKTLNAKLIINSFYGKHCSRRDREQRFYDFNKDIICFQEVTKENINEWEDAKLYAVQYGSAVTSWGRIQLRETCRKVGNDVFIYADTDSLKFNIDKDTFMKRCKENDINISYCKKDKRLGYWDFEFEFTDFKAVGQKKYMYQLEEGKDFKTKCAGLPDDIRKQIVRKEQFAIGSTFRKKAKRKVIGGNLLIDIKYSITDLFLR